MNNIKDDFRKFAMHNAGVSGMVIDDVIKSQAGYLNPYILEERQLNVTQLDVFSRLMMDRIIFLGTEINDYTANTDVNFYHSDWGLPKFHICKCSTYEQMVRSNRKYRYVVASRDDGIFVINKGYGKKNWQQSNEKLEVCKNCLKAIYWRGEFSLKKFFAKYPKNILNVNGHLKDNIAPLNDYPDNWNEISAKIRAKANYICASCGKNFKNIPGFLHVHHKNGLKYDISRENLVVLCENCHSKQPYHSHMIIHK